jgi:leucine dehydrogenase
MSLTATHDALADLIEHWDGERVICQFDRETGAWMFVCVHTTVGGVAGGGTRMRVYETPADGLADGMRLSAAMSRKIAVAGFDIGGAKAVLAVPAVPEGEERRALLLRYAELVSSLRGGFLTGPDMNISGLDANVIRERSEYVFGTSAGVHDGVSASWATANGVLAGIEASVAFAQGGGGLSGRTVLVQGLGAVGGHLIDLLAQEGATVLVSDIDERRTQAAVERLGARAIAPEAALHTECDVLAPCAVGGIIGEEAVERLRCRVVAGSANNPLAGPDTAEALRAAGILYAPDYVISGGGVLHALGMEIAGWDSAQLLERLRGIGSTLTEIYEKAAARDISTELAAEAIATERIAALRGGGTE